MANPVWGQLEKAQDDAETIEEAVARLIAEHEADAGAHTGTGESLETHKTQETVDHPAGSVVADKIPDGQLELHQYSYSRYVTQIDLGALANDRYSGSGFGSSLYAELSTGAVANVWKYADTGGDEEYNLLGDDTMNPNFRFRLVPSRLTNMEIYFGIGDFQGDNALGFKMVDGDLKAVWWDNDPLEHLEAITCDISEPHNYEVQVDSEVAIYWLIDGIVVNTLTWAGSDVTFSGGNSGMQIQLKTKTTDTYSLILYQILYEQDFI